MIMTTVYLIDDRETFAPIYRFEPKLARNNVEHKISFGCYFYYCINGLLNWDNTLFLTIMHLLYNHIINTGCDVG